MRSISNIPLETILHSLGQWLQDQSLLRLSETSHQFRTLLLPLILKNSAHPARFIRRIDVRRFVAAFGRKPYLMRSFASVHVEFRNSPQGSFSERELDIIAGAILAARGSVSFLFDTMALSHKIFRDHLAGILRVFSAIGAGTSTIHSLEMVIKTDPASMAKIVASLAKALPAFGSLTHLRGTIILLSVQCRDSALSDAFSDFEAILTSRPDLHNELTLEM